MVNLFDLIGRVMISAIFLFSGISKIFNYDGTIGWMEGYGMPGILLIPAIIIEILFIYNFFLNLATGAPIISLYFATVLLAIGYPFLLRSFVN